jgi:S1-C subfamily serine protease
LFNKFARLTAIEGQIGYFLHAPGPVSQPALEAKLLKVAKRDSEPDLAILTVADTRLQPLELETVTPSEGQEIQVIGYPQASDLIDAESSKYYAPTFSTGRISRMTPHTLQVDAPITNGNSGGPVVNLRGKVLGVIAVRALSASGGELPNFAGAVTVQSVESFAPDLFAPAGGE